MPDLLLELGVEELPAGACREALEQLPALAAEALADLRLEAGEIAAWVAPRRLTVVISGLGDERPGRRRRARGPGEAIAFDAAGAPTKAARGFARGQGVEVADLVVGEEDGRRFVFAEVDEPGRPTAELVPELAAAVVDGLRFGKTMRWGDGRGLRFSRPVRWIVALLDDESLRFTLHGLDSGRISRGHRFLGGPVELTSAQGYRDELRAVGAIADHGERRRAIEVGLAAAAAELGCTWSDPGGKLEEVLYLVEWPSVIVGRIAEGHLRLPERVLVTAMQSHQRYFPLHDAARALHPAFLAVSNGDPAHATVIARGNEDVLDARLQDAAFSFDKDRAAGLAALNDRLGAIVFHQRLGSMADKRERLVAGTAEVADAAGLDPDERASAIAAADLAKADQGAVLVAEFAELEGDVAAEYARREGHPEGVAQAIAEQYLPTGPASPTPASAAGASLALAEKIDNLVGAFLVDEAPTGSRDPYGLRRAAAGIVRVLDERGWDLELAPLLRAAAGRLRDQGADLAVTDDAPLAALDAFLADRLVHQLGGEGVGAEAAGAALGAALPGPRATAEWARQIERARHETDFAAAWTAHTRLARLADGKAEENFASVGDPAEDALATTVADALAAIAEARSRRDFSAALAAAVPLAAQVDRFLTDVMVNAPDPSDRSRRHALVREAAAALGAVADFTRITESGTK